MFTMHSLELLLLLLCLLLYLLYLILCEFRLSRKFSGHGPPTYPIIGCLVSFCKNRHRLLDWYTDLLSESATQTIMIRRLGAGRVIVTANPENVEYMLTTNFNNFPKGKAFTEVLGDYLGCGIFNVDGELWHTQRKLVSQDFSATSLREYVVNTLQEEVQNKLLPVLGSLAAETDKVVDLQELLRRLTFDIVCKVSLGIDPCCLDPFLSVSSLARAFDVASDISAKRAAAPVYATWKVKRMLGVGSERRLKEAIEEIHAFVMKIIFEKKKKINAGGGSTLCEEDLLSRMILAGHDEEVIRDMTISFVMAGRDTTSAAMTWLFWLLSRNPNVEQEVIEELGFVKDESLSNYEELKSMTLLKACLCESMRLYPPVAWDSKHADTDDLLPDGTPVRAGDRVTYFPYGMGRMKELWGDDRFEFKPERWILKPDREGRRALKKVCPYNFPIFQAGPRVCLGKELAFTQMTYVVASILNRFKIRPAGSHQPVFVPLLTAHMAGGFQVFVHKRQTCGR
ncbi:cytochrome P450 94B3-like [Cornus florida]|uniref:cytochrome P450 94B3-like n=1 Tax=Cornus florida TaxID=4283 RepID=UPI00289D5B27|nr:cytochrome P450 94B3-like [Cornus florida]